MNIKTGRRGFLGIMGGAAVAGPAAAKNVVAKLPTGLLGEAGPGLSIGGHGDPVSISSGQKAGGDWRLDEIQRLKNFIAGNLTDEEKERRERHRIYTRQTAISNHYASLQSVAGWRKLDLYHRDVEAMQDEINRSEAKGYLSRLLQEATR